MRLAIANNNGMLNYLRLYEKYHGNFQLKLPENPVVDLRIPNPWEELEKFCLGFDFEAMDQKLHSNTPYVVILIQALDVYKKKVLII